MADCSTGAGKTKMSLKYLVIYTESKEIFLKVMGTWLKDPGASLMGLLLITMGTVSAPR